MKKSLKIIVALTLIVSMLALNASAMTISVAKNESTQGVNKTIVLDNKDLGPYDISSFDHVHLWVYVENADLITYDRGNTQFELTSSNACDTDEMNWDMKQYPLSEGWNELWLPFDEAVAGKTGEVDMTAINYCRFYTFTVAEHEDAAATATVKVSQIEFTNGKNTKGSLVVDMTGGTGATAFGPEAYVQADVKTDATAVIFQKSYETPMDLSKYAANGYFKLVVWASADTTFNDTQLEFTSSGNSDQAEINFKMAELKAGWNTLYFAVKDANKTPGEAGDADLTAINFSRLYINAKNDATIKVASASFGTPSEVGRAADYTALDAAIAAGEAKVALAAARNIAYSYTTKSVYDNALSVAKNLSRDLADFEQATVDEATKALTDAADALKPGVSPWMYFVVYGVAGANLPVIGNLTTETLPATTTNPYIFIPVVPTETPVA